MPSRVLVIGAGVVGLSTAWFLQEHGCSVTVLEHAGVGAGASHGNAGWVIPRRAVPLTEPSALREGIRGALLRRGAVHLRSFHRPDTWSFLLQFARNCTATRWANARTKLDSLNLVSAAAFDYLASAGVAEGATATPIIAAFARVQDLDHLPSGDDLAPLDVSQARALVPQLSSKVVASVRIDDASYVQPDRFVQALADSFLRRGGEILHEEVTEILPGPVAATRSGETYDADALVVAVGGALTAFAKPLGIRVPLAVGRGYSFTVPTRDPVLSPIYLPAQRVACTPVSGGLRLAGIMEIDQPNGTHQARRFDEIITAIDGLLHGIDWNRRHTEWSGDRPLTADGLPLIGKTKREGVYAVGGHGMWGVTQGPASGRLLADMIVSGEQPEWVRAFDPLRSTNPRRGRRKRAA